MTLLVGSIFHMTRKIVFEMTYNVSMGTLNPTIPFYALFSAVGALCIYEMAPRFAFYLQHLYAVGWALRRICGFLFQLSPEAFLETISEPLEIDWLNSSTVYHSGNQMKIRMYCANCSVICCSAFGIFINCCH